jgi:hypothetical protein
LEAFIFANPKALFHAGLWSRICKFRKANAQGKSMYQAKQYKYKALAEYRLVH